MVYHIATASPVRAETWTAASPGNLLTGSNWGGTAPNGIDAIALIATQPTGSGDFSLSGAMTLGSFTYSNPQNRSLSGAGTLTFQVSSGTALYDAQTFLDLKMASVVLASDTEFRIASGTPVDITAVVSGGGALTKTGPGVLNLFASNSYAGATNISAGTVKLVASERIPNASAVSVASGATLDLNGFSETIGSLAGAGAVTLGSNASVNFIVGVNNGSTMYSGTISGAGQLSKLGSGTMTLSGSNEYTGLTIIEAGTLIGNTIGNVGANSAFGRDHFVMVGGSTLEYTGATASTNRYIELQASVPSSPNVTIAVTNAETNLTISGPVFLGIGSLGITKTGAGTLTLSGNNSYTGATTISAGALQFAKTNSMPSSSAVGVSTGATLAVNAGGSGEWTGGLSTAGSIGGLVAGTGTSANQIIWGSGSVLAIDTTSGSLSFGGAIANFRSGVGTTRNDVGLTKTGGGTLTLTNNANAYSGGTTIEGGTLNGTTIANSGTNSAFGAGSALAISNGATLRYTGGDASTNRTVALGAGGGAVEVTNSSATLTVNGQVSGAGQLTKTGTGTLILSTANNYAGGTAINMGTLRVTNATGTATGGGAVAINNSGVLAGTGHVVGEVTVNAGGAVAPGVGVGTLHLHSGITFNSSGAFNYEVNSSAAVPADYADLLNVGDGLTIDPAARFNYINSGAGLVPAGTKLTAISYGGSWFGDTFAGHPDDKVSFFQGQGFRVDYDDADAGVNQGGGAYGNHVTLAATALDGRLVVAGSPGYDSTTGNGFYGGTIQVVPGGGVNNAGTAVGLSQKYVSGSYVGQRAVRWDATGTAATELGNLGTSSSGITGARAYAVNNAGTAVGYSQKYVSGSYVGVRAVIWLPDASAVDLNDLGVVANPADGTWLLTEARALSSDGYVAGTGTFTPTTGSSYTRHWVTQVGLGGEWTDDFTGSLNGTWGRGPQWSTGTPAMQVGEASFSAPGAYIVALDRNEKTQSVDVNDGHVTLAFNGYTLEAMTGMTVGNDATLSGAGTIIGDLTFNDTSTLAPGASAGTLTVNGQLVLNSATVSAFELDGGDTTVGNNDNDLVIVNGPLTLDGTLNVTALGSFAGATPGNAWRLFNYSGALTNNVLNIGSMPALANPSWGYVVDTSTTGQVNLLISIVPEAPAWAFGLLIGAAFGVGRFVRSRRRAAVA